MDLTDAQIPSDAPTRLGEALAYAADAHQGQTRTGTDIPYIAHLLAVTALVIEAGGDEDTALAGALHDVAEDQGGRPRLADVRARFGDRVAGLVAALSDTLEDPKPPWRARKETYVAHLAGAPRDVLMVSAADKRHNLRAIVADYLASKFFLTVKKEDGRRHPRPPATIRAYRQCLAILVKDWGDTHWAQINRALAKNWIEDLMDETPSFGHAVYRVTRAALGTAEFIYPNDWHPGHVPLHANPFQKLDIPTPKTDPMPWPVNLVRPFVECARQSGQRWLAAHILFNSWLGQRVGDMVALPLNRFRFDRPLWIGQGKTGADVVLSWQEVPELMACARWLAEQRTAFDKDRREVATTWLIDETTGKAFTVDRIRNVYNDVRDKVCAAIAMSRIDGQPRWDADYLVKGFADDEYALDVRKLQLRALRATAVTQLANAGVQDIGAVTGHAEEGLSKILKFYRARTATRSANALIQRLTFEGGRGE